MQTVKRICNFCGYDKKVFGKRHGDSESSTQDGRKMFEKESFKRNFIEGEIEDMITICYDEELHKKREAEYHEELGEKRINLKIALWMKKKGMSNGEIQEATGLELDEIEEL